MLDARLAMDHADHRGAGAAAGVGRALSLSVTSQLRRRAGEIAVLPLVFDLPWLAAIFTVLNAAVLAIRIRAENRALAALRACATRDAS